MPNTNTTYFPSNQNDSICLLKQPEADTFQICSPVHHFLPCTPIKGNNNTIDNLSFTIIFLIVFAFVRLRGKDLFYNLLNILIKRKKAEIVLSEGIASNLICYILSLCLSFSAISVSITYMAWHKVEWLFSLYLLGGLFLYHFFLLMLVRLLGWTFNARHTADEIIVNLWTYHILTGLLISPFIISIFFVKLFVVIPLLKIVIFGLLLFMIVKFIRWVEILFIHRVSIFYMILYLCAFEIMPLLIIYKIVA